MQKTVLAKRSSLPQRVKCFVFNFLNYSEGPSKLQNRFAVDLVFLLFCKYHVDVICSQKLKLKER